MDQPGMVANPTRGQLNRENYVFLFLRSRLRIWSRLLIPNTSTESGAYSRGSSRLPRRRLSIIPSRSVLSSSGRATACR